MTNIKFSTDTWHIHGKLLSPALAQQSQP